MAFSLGSALGGYVDEAHKQTVEQQRQEQIELQKEEAAQRRQAFTQTQEELQRQRTAADVIAQELARVGQTPEVGTGVKGPPVQNSVMAIPEGAPDAPAIGLDGKPLGWNRAPTPPTVPGAEITKPGKPIYQSDAYRNAAAKLHNLGLDRYALDPLEKARTERYSEAFKLAAQNGDLEGAINHLNDMPDGFKATVKADPSDPTGEALIIDYRKEGGKGFTKKYKDKEEFLGQLAASSSPDNLMKWQLGNDKLNNWMTKFEAENAQRYSKQDQQLQLGLARLADRNQGGSTGSRGTGGGSGGKTKDGGDPYTMGMKTPELAKYLTPEGADPTISVATYQQLVSANRQAQIAPTLLAAASRNLVAHPESRVIAADPVTGDLGDYTNFNGNMIKIGGVGAGGPTIYAAPEKPGEKAVPMPPAEAQREIAKQAAVAQKSWLATLTPDAKSAAASLMTNGVADPAKIQQAVAAAQANPEVDPSRVAAAINAAKYMSQEAVEIAKKTAAAGPPSKSAVETVADYKKANVEPPTMTRLEAWIENKSKDTRQSIDAKTGQRQNQAGMQTLKIVSEVIDAWQGGQQLNQHDLKLVKGYINVINRDPKAAALLQDKLKTLPAEKRAYLGV